MAKRRAKKRARKSSRAKTRRRTSTGVKLPKEAVTLIVILRAREGQETILEAELRALVAPTRKEDGCLGYDLRSEERRVGKSVDLGGRRIIKKKKKNAL